MSALDRVLAWYQVLVGTPGAMEELAARAAAEARARPGPWRWYCRLCDATGEEPTEGERDTSARGHLASTPCGRHEVTGWAAAGKLLHVWTYPASACGPLN